MSSLPDWRAEVRARLRTVALAPEREAEIVDELAQHLEERWREARSSGASPEDAARIARSAFSEPLGLARQLASLHQARWIDPAPPAATRALSLEGLGADTRLALRSLRGSPSFAIGALLVLALGIGATTAIFSVVDAIVLRGLPFEDAGAIVAVGERRAPMNKPGPRGGMPLPLQAGVNATDPQALSRVQPQNYLDWTVQQQVFESIAAIAEGNDVTLQMPGGEPEAVARHRVTANFFDLLRVRPAIGRAFTAEHEVDGRDRLVVLSDAFWRRRFGSDTGIVGRTIVLNGEPHDVVGVMPRGFTYPVGAARPADMWAPYVVPPEHRVRGRGISIYLQCIARLKPGVSLAQAQIQMDQVAAAIERANPQWSRGHRIGLRPLRDHLVGASTTSWLLMLLTAVGIVLLIACANVANLWLARASTRARDLAVRSALGASRWRLVRQWLVESLLASGIGAATGLLLAWPAIHLLKAAMPEDMARVAHIGLDLRVTIVAAGLALLTGLLSGIAPALQASRVTIVDVLNPASRGGAGTQRRIRSSLVVVEVALAVVLLVGAALFVGSFVNVMRVDLGFDSDRMLTLQLSPPPEPGGERNLGPTFEELVTRIGRIPGVVSAAASNPGIPLRLNSWINGLTVPGRPPADDPSISTKAVTPDYHRTLGIPLRSGRLFTADDRAGGASVILVSETAARRFFEDEPPVGRTVLFNQSERTVVGVVADARQSSLEANPHSEAYLPMAQNPRSGYAWLVIRTQGDPYAVLPAVRTILASAFPEVPARSIATMNELVAGQTAARRLNMLVLGLLGLLGLVISAVGVFGVMAWLVAQRTREIGVRIALGATRARVVSMVVTEAAGLGVLGIAIGGAAAWYLATRARRFLFGLEPHDVAAFIVPASLALAAALVASALPALRAAAIDPTIALRSE